MNEKKEESAAIVYDMIVNDLSLRELAKKHYVSLTTCWRRVHQIKEFDYESYLEVLDIIKNHKHKIRRNKK